MSTHSPRTTLKPSKATIERVERRQAVTYVAHRRDFTTPAQAAFNLTRSLQKALVWTQQ